MELNFTSVLSPLVVLIVGFITRKILWSLALGIVIASIQVEGSFFSGILLALQKLYKNLEITKLYNGGFWSGWNVLICAFLFILGIFITLLHHSGAAKAYENAVKSRLKNKKQAEAASLVLSMILFIDDYFSSLTVGSVMRPVTDAFRIPRAKLAYMVDSMAAPLTIICPISSWVAATVGFLRDSGFSNDETSATTVLASPYLAYLNIIPYIFYSFVVIAGSWLIVFLGLSFGKMAWHERLALSTYDLHGGNEPPEQKILHDDPKYAKGNLADFFLMIGCLIISIVSGLLYSGNFILFGGPNDFASALRHSSAAHGLFLGGVGVFVFQILWMSYRKLLKFKSIPPSIWQGIKLMLPSVTVLIFAWTLGDILRNDLHTGKYLADLFIGNLGLSVLPLSFFLASAVTSICIGSSWGTAAVMFPIAVQMYITLHHSQTPLSLDEVGYLFPILGAVLSGAVAGDHISPISDTTIMSATSTGMSHADHVETQLEYALPMVVVCAAGFLMLGIFWQLNSSFSLILSYTLMIASIFFILTVLHRFSQKKRQHELKIS